MTESKEKSKSEASKNFESNLDQIMAFVHQMASAQIQMDSMKTAKAIKKVAATGPDVNAKKLERIVEKYKQAVDGYLAYVLPACRWMSVMLVSFLETFLEDGLVEIAQRNPRVVKAVEVQTSRIFEVAT